MKQRVIDTIKVILMLGISIVAITLLYIYEGKAHAPDKTLPVPQDTIPTPKFYDQEAKEGLQAALEYYDLYHPEIAYAQAQLETGYFKSQGCLRDNNLFGLYNSSHKRYHRFGHWTESVVAYKDWIQRRYKPPNDYYKFLERINYASDPLYTWKLKQIVRKNESRRSIGASSSDSLQIHTSSIPDRLW